MFTFVFEDKNTESLENAYMGCWGDNETLRDLPYLIWTRPEDATVPGCAHDCRTRGFEYAGLQVFRLQQLKIMIQNL